MKKMKKHNRFILSIIFLGFIFEGKGSTSQQETVEESSSQKHFLRSFYNNSAFLNRYAEKFIRSDMSSKDRFAIHDQFRSVARVDDQKRLASQVEKLITPRMGAKERLYIIERCRRQLNLNPKMFEDIITQALRLATPIMKTEERMTLIESCGIDARKGINLKEMVDKVLELDTVSPPKNNSLPQLNYQELAKKSDTHSIPQVTLPITQQKREEYSENAPSPQKSLAFRLNEVKNKGKAKAARFFVNLLKPVLNAFKDGAPPLTSSSYAADVKENSKEVTLESATKPLVQPTLSQEKTKRGEKKVEKNSIKNEIQEIEAEIVDINDAKDKLDIAKKIAEELKNDILKLHEEKIQQLGRLNKMDDLILTKEIHEHERIINRLLDKFLSVVKGKDESSNLRELIEAYLKDSQKFSYPTEKIIKHLDDKEHPFIKQLRYEQYEFENRLSNLKNILTYWEFSHAVNSFQNESKNSLFFKELLLKSIDIKTLLESQYQDSHQRLENVKEEINSIKKELGWKGIMESLSTYIDRFLTEEYKGECIDVYTDKHIDEYKKIGNQLTLPQHQVYEEMKGNIFSINVLQNYIHKKEALQERENFMNLSAFISSPKIEEIKILLSFSKGASMKDIEHIYTMLKNMVHLQKKQDEYTRLVLNPIILSLKNIIEENKQYNKVNQRIQHYQKWLLEEKEELKKYGRWFLGPISHPQSKKQLENNIKFISNNIEMLSKKRVAQQEKMRELQKKFKSRVENAINGTSPQPNLEDDALARIIERIAPQRARSGLTEVIKAPFSPRAA